jgi:hypothetical protein
MKGSIEMMAGIFFMLAIFGLAHQRVVADYWFNWQQFWHHEPLIVLCVGIAITLMVGKHASFLKRIKLGGHKNETCSHRNGTMWRQDCR